VVETERKLEVELGCAITPESMMVNMLQKKKKWDVVVKFITAVLSRKKAEEWAIQTAGRNL